MIHRFWLREHGIEGTYEAIDVAPEDFGAFIARIRAGEFAGGNVTIPNKEAAFRAVDWHDEAARAIGAVNTLWMDGDRLCGGNTDAYGFAASLDAETPGWETGRIATVLGAGGASRAVLHALQSQGFSDIRIINRTMERARVLAAEFGAGVSAHALDSAETLLPDTDLLVNTTSLGMHGQPEQRLDLAGLPSHAVVTDIVYIPLETPLLAAARARGLKTVDGLGMLLHQAVPGFEHWFGVRPQVTQTLRDLVVADIRGHR